MSRLRMIMMLLASVLGLVYIGLFYIFHTLTGAIRSDGIIGVVLGLFISVHPAAGFLDMFFFGKDGRNRSSLKSSSLLWLVLYLLVLLIGWHVIFIGLNLLLGKGGYD